MLSGKPGRQTFQENFVARKKNIFFHLGQLTALSIIQDGPGLPIFSDIVTDYILLGKPCILNVDDLPDGLKDIIVMVCLKMLVFLMNMTCENCNSYPM